MAFHFSINVSTLILHAKSIRERRNRNEIRILPSVRGARRILHNSVLQINCTGDEISGCLLTAGRKGGAGARGLSQSFQEGNRRGSVAAIYREERPKFPQCFRALRVLAIAASFRRMRPRDISADLSKSSHNEVNNATRMLGLLLAID